MSYYNYASGLLDVQFMFSIKVDREITLRLPSLKHAEELFSVIERNRAFLRQYLQWVDHNVVLADTQSFIKTCRKEFKKDAGIGLCIFYHKRIVGTIGLHYLDKVDHKTEIGYWLSEDHQGKGIMRRSCQALIHYVFDALKLHRIEIRCASYNLASQRIPENLHFTKEGIARESICMNGRFYDAIIYSLLSTDLRN